MAEWVLPWYVWAVPRKNDAEGAKINLEMSSLWMQSQSVEEHLISIHSFAMCIMCGSFPKYFLSIILLSNLSIIHI